MEDTSKREPRKHHPVHIGSLVVTEDADGLGGEESKVASIAKVHERDQENIAYCRLDSEHDGAYVMEKVPAQMMRTVFMMVMIVLKE